ncbi:Arabinanase levansucrase invertase [Fusarium agapanthi]|uniref:Arabinanase levansucrase invertase n=1 Tax=Fusarium agapanthi TaxID=1803897 RepID=A0A9P5EB27_9HYPO|nr:Arabinanase levansucrase invertase [Fusarium agapanthi]
MLSILNPTTILSALAALPILTSGSPTGAIPAGPQFAKREISCNSNFEGYAFLYFGNRDENIYLAASNGNDAISFTELNNGKPILTSTKGDGGVRDPSSCGHMRETISTSSRLIFALSAAQAGETLNALAADLETYVVYWASGIYDNKANPNHDPIEYQRMVYATTDEFITFSEPKLWQDGPPNGRIDSTVIKEDGVYYRFTKATINGCADIVQESSASLSAGLDDWRQIASCIGKNAGAQEMEGPSIFKTNCNDVNGARYILLADEFGGNDYVPLESTDLAGGKWTLRTGYKYPESPRHGTIIPLTLEELQGIQKAFPNTV